MNKLNNNKLMELDCEELQQTNGGGLGIAILVVCCCLGLGSCAKGCADADSGK